MKHLSILMATVGIMIICSLGVEVALSQNDNETTIASNNETSTGQEIHEEWFSPLLVNESMPGDMNQLAV